MFTGFIGTVTSGTYRLWFAIRHAQTNDYIEGVSCLGAQQLL
jgi:hypothetical protein